MTKGEKVRLITAIAEHLDTQDRRIMFLKCTFKGFEHHIQLDKSSEESARNIVEYFENRQMLGSITATINTIFETELTISY